MEVFVLLHKKHFVDCDYHEVNELVGVFSTRQRTADASKNLEDFDGHPLLAYEDVPKSVLDSGSFECYQVCRVAIDVLPGMSVEELASKEALKIQREKEHQAQKDHDEKRRRYLKKGYDRFKKDDYDNFMSWVTSYSDYDVAITTSDIPEEKYFELGVKILSGKYIGWYSLFKTNSEKGVRVNHGIPIAAKIAQNLQNSLDNK